MPTTIHVRIFLTVLAVIASIGVLAQEHDDNSSGKGIWLQLTTEFEEDFADFDYDDATLAAESAADIALVTFGPHDERTIESLRNLGDVLGVLGQYDEAESVYQRALNASRDALGDSHRETIRILNGLGKIYSSQERYSLALPTYQEALDLGLDNLGDTDTDTLRSLNGLAGVRIQTPGSWREDDLETLVVEALELARTHLGLEHELTLEALNNLGLLRLRQRHVEIGDEWVWSHRNAHRAVMLLEQAVNERTEVLGEMHPDTLTSVHDLAVALRSVDRFDLAEPFFLRALYGREQVLGARHRDTLATLRTLMTIYSSVHRRADSLALYEEFRQLTD